MRAPTIAILAALALLVGCTGPDRATPAPSAPPPASTTSAQQIVSSTWDRGRFTLSDGAVSEDWGVAAAPTSGGPHPLAIVLHGNHPTCPSDTGEGRTWPCPEGTELPNQEGLTYLVDALAGRGFVAIAPGINVQYTLGSGEPAAGTRTAEIAERVIGELRAGELGIDPALVDTDRIVLIGHSQGGQDSVLMATGQTSFTEPVAGLVMLQPALNVQDALPLADVPSVVVISECDGDTGVVGGQYVTDALLRTRTTPAAAVVLEGANHNFTNTRLRPDPFPVEAPGCATPLDAGEQQDLLAATVPELAHAVLADGGGRGWAGDVFASPTPTPPAGIDLGVVRAGEPVAAVPGPGPAVPADVRLDGLTATYCPFGYSTAFTDPGTEACHRPELPLFVGLPRTIAASWSAAGASLTAPVDVAPGGSIVVRLVPDVADERLSGERLRVRLSTPEGATSDFDVPIPASTREEIPPFTLAHALTMWSTLALPVPQGATAVTIEVVAPDAGSMQILSID